MAFMVLTASEYCKDATNLTPIQAAGIAAILPNPRKFTATSSSSYINKRKSKITKVMRTVGKINY
jgi:monofunctional biosynthetic peptidoglycan transglycosylase